MKKIYLSALSGNPLNEYLRNQGFELHLINGENSPVYKEVATHADIYMCQMGLWENSRLFIGNIRQLTKNYPGNIIYNAVCTGKYFIHNLKYTSPELLTDAEARHQEMSDFTDPLIKINVPQGYTRCSCLPVDDRSFITSDEGIAKALAPHDADVLLIDKGHVKLPGFDYGFIGGCAGHVLAGSYCNHESLHKNAAENSHYYKRTIVFNGNLSAHPDYKKIAAFIKDRDVDLVYFCEYPLEDIGSILVSYQCIK